MKSAKIRAANHLDAVAMSDLATASAKKFITPDFTKEAAKDFLTTLQPQEFKKKLENGYTYFLAESDGALLGFIGMKGYTHVYHLYVDERHHQQGIASRLWQKAREHCRINGQESEYTVNASLYAKPFYEKLGFIARPAEQQDCDGIICVPMKLKLK